MTTVWIEQAENAADGDYVLTPGGDVVTIDLVENGAPFRIGEVAASALPDLATAEQDQLLTAVRGVETAQINRGG